MTVLLTGATGFLGWVVIERLIARGSDVVAFHRPDREPPPLARVTWLSQDLSQPVTADLPAEIDGVVHLAQSRRYREFPAGALDVFEINAAATVRLLEYALGAGATSFVYASSGAVYAPSSDPVRESDERRATNFYAASKLAGELAADQFRSLLAVHILRFFFIYGPGQENMFVPGIIGRVRDGADVTLAGEDGMRVNPVYVEDAADAVLAVLGSRESSTLNVAGPEAVSLRELATAAGEILNRAPRFVVGEPGGDLLASVEGLGSFGIEPKVGVREGLRRTIASAPS